jgi:anthranilate synthase/aminodeoxychorismate synthase-like glutamine amidotransferase
MLLLIDNYDSFTYNLAQYLGELGARLLVVRNDEITVDEIASLRPGGLVLSPGPCTPDQSGVCLEALRRLPERLPGLPILGVCLGHQAIAQVFGGRVVRARQAIHGKVWPVLVEDAGDPLFFGLPSPFHATRYHSLIVEDLPGCLRVTARSPEGEIMALRHLGLPIHGIQFHPESIGTPYGKQILDNFLKRCLRDT